MSIFSKRATLFALLAVIASPIFGGSLLAQNQDAQIDELLNEVRRLNSRVDELESERESQSDDLLESRVNALSESLAIRGANDFNVHWNKGLRFDTADKSFRLKIGGRIQNDWAFGTQDDDFEEVAGRFEDGTRFRRARIYVAGQIHEHVIFKAQYDFAGGDADFNDVWLGLRKIGFIDRLRVGHFKVPFSLEQQTSSKYITFLERSLADVFTTGRETGIGANGTAMDQKITWAISVFHDTDSYGDSNPADDGDYGIAARVTWVPWECDICGTLLHVGAGIIYQNTNNEALRLRQRPEVSISPRIFDTGTIEADDVLRLNLEIAFIWGSFSAQAEYFYLEVEGTDGNPDPAFWGGYAYVSYFLTGEQRNYQHKDGTFGRISPNENFLEGDGMGAWEVAARFSYLDLNDDDALGGKSYNLTIALNWYLNPNTRVMINYIFTNLDDFGSTANEEGESHVVALRFQIDF